MGMWAVPIYIGKIFTREITETGNHIQEVSAAIHTEYIFILLGVVAIAVAVMLFVSSRKRPELGLDKPASE
jgi:sugar phosphate permease